MQTIIINSITAVLSTQSKFDLLFLSQRISNVIYNKKRFPGLVIRKNSPKATYLVFQSGKIIILGCSSLKDAEYAAKKIIKTFAKILNQKVQQKCFQITNILGSAILPFEINIAKLADQTNSVKHDSYPGLIYFMKNPVKSVSIFPSGKLILVGAKKIQNIEEAVEILEKDLFKFRKNEITLQQQKSKKTKTKSKLFRKKLSKQFEDQDETIHQQLRND